MSEWTQVDRRIGMWSAAIGATIGFVYVITGLIGIAARPPGPNPLNEVDPYLALLEIFMSLAAVDLVILMAAVYAYAAPDRKTLALAALSFTIVFALLTCSLHFASLTVGRQTDRSVSPLLSHQLSFVDRWPTLALALDLFAWDFFLGLALVFAAPVFKGQGLTGRVRVTMMVAGSLCLIGTLGPASGNLDIQYVGIAGYVFAFTVASTLLALLFSQRTPSQSS